MKLNSHMCCQTNHAVLVSAGLGMSYKWKVMAISEFFPTPSYEGFITMNKLIISQIRESLVPMSQCYLLSMALYTVIQLKRFKSGKHA